MQGNCRWVSCDHCFKPKLALKRRVLCFTTRGCCQLSRLRQSKFNYCPLACYELLRILLWRARDVIWQDGRPRVTLYKNNQSLTNSHCFVMKSAEPVSQAVLQAGITKTLGCLSLLSIFNSKKLIMPRECLWPSYLYWKGFPTARDLPWPQCLNHESQYCTFRWLHLHNQTCSWLSHLTEMVSLLVDTGE